jgi:hypothetical protein
VEDDVDLDGFDIIFKAEDDATCGGAGLAPCILDHEIEIYDETNDKLVAWVRIPVLDFDNNTTIYLYYGNAAVTAATENPTGVWEPNYLGVWHFHDDFLDSTSSNYDGTNSGSTDATGRIANGQEFDGVADYVDVSVMNPQSYDNFTISAWYKSTDAAVSDDEYIFGHLVTYANGPGIVLSTTDDAGETDHLRLSIYDNATNFTAYYSTSDVVDQQFHYVAGIRDNGRIKLYVDGGEEIDVVDVDAGETISVDAPSGPFVGDLPGDTEQVHGILDEMRISDIARSQCWVETEHSNQKPTSTLMSVGGEEASGEAGQNSSPSSFLIRPAARSPLIRFSSNSLRSQGFWIRILPTLRSRWMTMVMGP